MAKIIYANVRDSKLIGTIADVPADEAHQLVRTGQARIPTDAELAAAAPAAPVAETPAPASTPPATESEADTDDAKPGTGRRATAKP